MLVQFRRMLGGQYNRGQKAGLSSIQGEQRYLEAMRGYLDETWNQARRSGDNVLALSEQGGGVDINFLKHKFGFDDKQGLRYSTLKAALKDTPLEVEFLEKFVNVLDDAVRIVPKNVNMFIGRRVTLGGLRSLRTLLSPTAAIGTAAGGGLAAGFGGAITGVTTVLLLRNAGRVLMNPTTMELATTALDSTIKIDRRRRAALILITMFEQQEREAAVRNFIFGNPSDELLQPEQKQLK